MLKFHPLRVKARDHVAEDAVCITFDLPPELRDVYRFHAGQHVAVRLAVAGADVRRTYSLVCPAGSAELRIGVRVLDGGEVSPHLARQIEIGQTLDVLPPNGNFHTTIEPARAKRYVFFAAGSGITPVLSIARTVLEQEPGSEIALFYGNRTVASTMFLEEVFGLKNRFPARFSVNFVMSREPQEIELLNGRLDGSKVRQFAGVFFDVASIDEFFICGPDSMVDEVRSSLVELGARGRLVSEVFTSAARLRPDSVLARNAMRDASTVSNVSVLMDGRVRKFAMPRDGGVSVLEAATHNGIELPYSCLAGVCSTCRARVVRGKARMEKNIALEAWEVDAGYVLCCQAQPVTPELELSYDE